jgi:hypothetical protein
MPDWNKLIAAAEAVAEEAEDARRSATEAADKARDLVSMLEAAAEAQDAK